MVTVRVLWKSSGKPAPNADVAVFKIGLIGDPKVGERGTDADGEASFETDPGRGKIIVDGRTRFEGNLEGTITVSI